MGEDELVLQPGSIVAVIGRRADNHGILKAKESTPDAAWLAIQRDARWREHADGKWWSVLALSGGGWLVPETCLRPVRPPTREDVSHALEHANDAGKREIVRLCPEIASELLRSMGVSDAQLQRLFSKSFISGSQAPRTSPPKKPLGG